MISAFARAFAQLGDPAFRRPLVLGLLGALLIFVALWTGLGIALNRTQLFETLWLDRAIDALGGVAALILTVILYPVIAAAILSFFLDAAIDAVEARHYPGLPAPRRPGIAEQAVMALRLLLLGLVLNLFALPLYLIPAINLMVFYGLNGYILGREYLEMVAVRRLEPAERRRFRRESRVSWFAMGVVIAILATLPVINLAAPLVAVGAMTHGFMAWRARLSHRPQ